MSTPSQTPSSSSVSSLSTTMSTSVDPPPTSTSTTTNTLTGTATPSSGAPQAPSSPTTTTTTTQASSSTSSSTTSSSVTTTTQPTTAPSDTSITNPPTSSTSVPTTATSSSLPDTSSSSPSSSTSSTSNTSTSTFVPASVSTIVQTTVVVTTNGQASTVVSTIEISTANPSAGASNSGSGSSSSSHVGAIVGGVVGGVAAVVIIVLLIWFFRRRRARDEFDGNFDPDRVVVRERGRGDADLLASAAGVTENEVTPYTYGMQQNGQGGALLLGPAAAGTGAGAAYGVYEDQKSNGSQPLSSGSHYSPTAPSEAGSGSGGPNTSFNGGGMYPYGASPYVPVSGDQGHPSPGSSLPATFSAQSHAQLSAKEREVHAQQTLYGVAGSSGAPFTLQNADGNESRSVIVHRDSGRVPLREQEVALNEIPPTYDSIRSDGD